MIPGFELSIHNDKSPEKVMHVNVMSRNSTYDFEQDEEFDIPDPEDGLAFLRNHAKNNILMLNHPYWSALEWDEIIDLPESPVWRYITMPASGWIFLGMMRESGMPF